MAGSDEDKIYADFIISHIDIEVISERPSSQKYQAMDVVNVQMKHE